MCGGNGRLAYPSEFSTVCSCTGLFERYSYTVRPVNSEAVVKAQFGCWCQKEDNLNIVLMHGPLFERFTAQVV